MNQVTRFHLIRLLIYRGSSESLFFEDLCDSPDELVFAGFIDVREFIGLGNDFSLFRTRGKKQSGGKNYWQEKDK